MRTFIDVTARPEIDERLLDEAEAWHSALELGDADWDGYTAWLEADSLHREAFDAVVLTHRIVDERVGNLGMPAPIEQPAAIAPPVSHRRWVYGAVAATVALGVGISTLWLRPADTVYSSSQQEYRQLALGSGIAVDLAPASRLVVIGGNATTLELAQGEAVFTVAHDPGRGLAIKAGEYVVGDIGTTFSVNLSAHSVKVGVAEGRLTVAADGGDATAVSAGQQVIAPRSGGSVHLSQIAPPDIGSWRQGRLVYSDTPLAVVAADISRYSGKAIEVDPAIGSQSFSGVLTIGDGSKLLASLADIAGLTYEETGNHARLGAGPAR
ncbi:FecR domain-containing protein [Novosphingobium sp. G106]|uniref:FecR family protein n=1 Tax=Novosphingobium sp. G106 TaxID=2849500 RepID=UPI001C2D3669|nr:FecR domain-containing protein [Novosphingobium sp. G106]MBV1692621.1 FecR domain-containing protein [Novosphingobium sp. G106]